MAQGFNRRGFALYSTYRRKRGYAPPDKRRIKRQRIYIDIDPYANAFKREADSHEEFNDYPKNNPIVWERKYEIDSLCYPLRLTYLYWKASGDSSVLGEDFLKSAKTTVALWRTEQRHFEKSDYLFIRKNAPEKDTLSNNGLGAPVDFTGMTWSGFRPSDDCCMFNFLIPSEMMCVVAMKKAAALLKHTRNLGFSFFYPAALR